LPRFVAEIAKVHACKGDPSEKSGGDHADTDDDEDEETGGMFDPHPPHSRCSHSHSS